MDNHEALSVQSKLSPNMVAAVTFYPTNPQGSTARRNNGNGGGTHGALVRRGLVALGVDERGVEGFFLSPRGWEYLRHIYGITRPADTGRLTVEEALTEAYPADETKPTVHYFHDDSEAYGASQCRDDIRDGDVLVIESEPIIGILVEMWPSAVTAETGEFHDMVADFRTFKDGRYAASVDVAEQAARDAGYALAEHAGVAKGSAPKHATHPDVVAARAVLGFLKAATLADHTDISKSADERDETVNGYVIEPCGGGRVAVYWTAAGVIVDRHDRWNGPALSILREKFLAAGWNVEPASLPAVFAWNPSARPSIEPTSVE